MAKKLTAGVLQGKSYKETFTVEWQGEEFEVEIQPLNNKEATEVEELTQEGVNVKAKPGMNGKMTRTMDFDTKKNFRGRKASNIKAVALGTTDESITEEVVEQEFPPKFVSEIGSRIKEISGIGNQDQAKEALEDDSNPSDESGDQ